MNRPSAGQVRKIWVDTDVALGAERGDVDDGFALAAIVAAAQRAADTHVQDTVELLGVSAVSGNTDAATAAHCAQELLTVANCTGVRVTPSQDAAESIAELPNGAFILAIGPLTNLAGALRLDPTLLQRTVVRIVATVRNRRRHPILARFCLNVGHDPDSAQQVFTAARNRTSGLPSAPNQGLRIVPLDSALRLRVSSTELEDVANYGTLGRYLAQETKRWLKQSWWRYQSRSFPAWDLLAAMDALGLVPGAQTMDSALVDFDPKATWHEFLGLLSLRDQQPGASEQRHSTPTSS